METDILKTLCPILRYKTQTFALFMAFLVARSQGPQFRVSSFLNVDIYGSCLAGNFRKDPRISHQTTASQVSGMKLISMSTLPVELTPEVGRVYLMFAIRHDRISAGLCELHLIDLLSITWTSKAFRSLLLSRRLEWLWRRVYELDPTVPSCPEDMSPPEWTSLIFGELGCQVSCEVSHRAKHTDNIQQCTVNFVVCSFYLRKRVCDHCHVRGCLKTIQKNSASLQPSTNHPSTRLDDIERFSAASTIHQKFLKRNFQQTSLPQRCVGSMKTGQSTTKGD